MLYDRLEEVLGVGSGDILMEYLPPVGWADVATRRDLDAAIEAVRHEMTTMSERIEHRFERIDDSSRGRRQRSRRPFEARSTPP